MSFICKENMRMRFLTGKIRLALMSLPTQKDFTPRNRRLGYNLVRLVGQTDRVSSLVECSNPANWNIETQCIEIVINFLLQNECNETILH